MKMHARMHKHTREDWLVIAFVVEYLHVYYIDQICFYIYYIVVNFRAIVHIDLISCYFPIICRGFSDSIDWQE